MCNKQLKINSGHEQAKAHFEKPQMLANSDNDSELFSPRVETSLQGSPKEEMTDSKISKKV